MSENANQKQQNGFASLRLWGIVGLIIVIIAGILLIPRLSASPAKQIPPTATSTPTKATITTTSIPATVTLTSTPAASPTPTAIPLTWKQISDGADFSRDTVNDVFIDPKNPDDVYIGTQSSGIYKSADGGLSWQPATSGPVSRFSKLSYLPSWANPNNRQVVFRVLSSPMMQKTINGGKTWNKSKDLIIGPYTLAFDLTNENMQYLGDGTRLFKTHNSGASWKEMYKFPTDFISTIMPSSTDPESVFVGTQGLFHSNNGGSNWQNHSKGIGAGRIELMINPNDMTLFIVEKTYVEGQWFIQRLFHSLDGGHSWDKLIDQRSLALSFGANNTIYYSVFKSNNNGKTWIKYRVPFFDDGQTFILANPRDPKIIYSFTSWPSYYRISLDAGKTWQADIYKRINSNTRLFFDRQQGQVVYATFANGILRSTDGGQSWNDCLSNNTLIDSESALAIDPQNSNLVYVSVKGIGTYISNDGCKSWMPKKSSPTYNINSIATDPNIPNIVYMGTQSGAYVSYDQGEHWSQINDGLIGTDIVYSIAVDSQSNVYATTPFGIFKLESK